MGQAGVRHSRLYNAFQIEIENTKQEKGKYENDYTRITISHSHCVGPINSASGLGTTQAWRTEKGRHAGYEDGHAYDDHDDELTAPQVNDGLHDKYVRLRHLAS